MPTTTAMQLARKVEDWSLYTPEASDGRIAYVRDLDLAERAGLAKPRDIRTTIRGLIKSGRISPGLSSAGSAGATKRAATCVEVHETVPRGRRKGSQIARSFYLNEKATLLVLMRLNTQVALDLQDEVIDVYMAYRDGLLTPTVPAPDAVSLAQATFADLRGLLEEVRHLRAERNQLRAEVESTTKTIADAPPLSREMRQVLREYASALGAPFATAEGEYRRQTGLPGYKRTRIADVEQALRTIRQWTEETTFERQRDQVSDLMSRLPSED